MTDSVPDDGRCSRNDGRRWRCSRPRFSGSRYCEGHFNYYHGKKSGAGSNSRVRVPSVPSVEKKKKTLGHRSTKSKPAVMRVQGEGGGKGETAVRVSADSEINEKKPIGDIVSEIKEEEKKKKRCRPAKVKKAEGISDARASDPSTERKKNRGRPLIVKEKGKKTAVAPNAYGEKKKRRRKSSGIEITGEEEEAGRVMKLGQIWSFPKEACGFLQSYARIDRIIPNPSTVRVTPLVPHPITDEENLFLEQGLSLACGVFKASESTLCKEISVFTHKVMFEIEGNGNSFYKIFPKRGEIWAVYCKWDYSKKRFEYKLVELESDFNEEDGVKVFGLVQVEGVDGVYRRQEHDGFHLVRSFSRGFMPMFSHLVPTCRIVENGETRWKVMLH